MTIRRRRLSARASAALWGLVGLAGALDTLAPVATAPYTGAFLGFLVPIAVWAVRLFGVIGRITLTSLHAAFMLFRTSMIGITRGLKSGLWGIGKLLGRTVDVFQWLYGRVLRPALSWAFRKLQALELWLKQLFAPVFAKIAWLKEHINLFYRRFVRPVLDLIDLVRQANRVLRVFGVDLLTKLDAILSEIERRIEQPFQWIYRRLTDVEQWLNRIVTLDGLFQRVTLVRSLWRDIRQTSNMWWHQFHHEMTRDELIAYFQPLPKREVAEVVGEFRAFALDGGGPDAARINEAVADFELIVRDVRL